METKTIEIQRKNVVNAYNKGSEETKQTLKHLFPNMDFNSDVRDRIKTWEDVCDELQISSDWEEGVTDAIASFGFNNGEMKCALAHMKILAIAKALNEGWELTKEAEENNEGYGIYWMRRDGVRGDADFQFGSSCAPGYVGAGHVFGDSVWDVVPRLSFKTRELAEYAVTQFPDIWREYYNNYEQK